MTMTGGRTGQLVLCCILVVCAVIFVFLVDRDKHADVAGQDQDEGRLVPVVKRLITGYEDQKWPHAIVLYTYDVNETAKDEVMVETNAAMRVIEKHTCIRFYPWVPNVSRFQYNYSDESHAKFIAHPSLCYSALGFAYGSVNGRDISCCHRGACVHELGHLLGMAHEIHSILGKGFIDGVNPDARLPRYPDYVSYEYDISSPMHGKLLPVGPYRTRETAFAKDLTPLTTLDNFYAFYKEITFAYYCKERRCADVQTKCDNDGYLGYVEGECTCVCPVGLDPDTGCTTIRKPSAESTSWPHGAVRMLAPKEGCAEGTEVTTPLRHYNTTVLENCQPFLLDNDVTSSHTDLKFCRSAGTSAPSSQKWPAGRYCLFRDGDTCPPDFASEYIQFTYADPAADDNSTPRDRNLRLELCCRDDGYTFSSYSEEDIALSLPSLQPIVLLPTLAGDLCHSLTDMVLQTSCLTLSGNTTGLEVKVNTQAKVKVTEGGQRLQLHYCHYTPISRKECGGLIELTPSSPTATILSPNYPEVYDSPSHCFWFLKAPEDSNIILRFPEMDVETDSDGNCLDHLEIRYNVPGQKGILFCGKKKESNVRSYNHTVMIKLHSNTAVGGKFKIQAHLVDPASHCFNMADRGASYRGNVNFTRDFLPCLPWREVTQCDLNLYNQRAAAAPLESNYCRNPDNSFRPWCYFYNKENACERYYCDVCQLEDRYDHYADCQELKAQGFCQADRKKAMEGCAKTCQDHLSFPTVEPAKACTNPCAAEGGTLVGAGQDSYQAGDVVTCRCQDGGLPINTTCLTDGSWSVPQDGYVCGACPSGWPRLGDHCYTFVYTRVRFVEAEAACAAMGGQLATIKDESEELTLKAAMEPLENTWIGLDDRQQEGTFVWSDGTTLLNGTANWDKDEPNVYDCAYVTGYPDLKWKTAQCDRADVRCSYACKVHAGTRKLCRDQRSDCQTELAALPSMCVDFPGFAAQDCARTCRVCKDSADSCADSQCQVPAPGSTVTLVTTASSIAQAQYVEYKCKDNMVLASGNLKRACLPCGKLSGSPPVCQDQYAYPIEINEGNQMAFGNVGYYYTVYTGSSSLVIPRDGEITHWRFYNSEPGKIVLTVWRPVPSEGPYAYEFVGRNDLAVTAYGREVEVEVPACQRILVQAGDSIGPYYPYALTGPQVYMTCVADTYPQFSNVTKLDTGGTPLEEGQVYQFQNSTFCAVFALEATVQARVPCQLPATPPHTVKVTASDVIEVGERVTYRCSTGYSFLSGDLERECGVCAALSGAEPTCGDDSTVYEVNKVPLIQREGFSWLDFAFTGDIPYFKITRDGEITQWKFYSTQEGKGRFLVWRPRPDLGSLQFEFVGKNLISSNVTDQPVTADVPQCDRIQVKAGDVIGVYYDYWNKIGVERTICDSEEQPGFSVANLQLGHTSMQEGTVYNFTEAGCKIFSVRAVVGPVPACSLPPAPANGVKVTVGDSVTLGQEAVYQCQPGFQLLSGDLRRLCNVCRQLEGIEPTCGDASTTYEVNKVDLIKRDGFDIYKNSFTGDNPHFKITRDGEITQWKFYSTLAGKGRFMVWRPRPDVGNLQFEFVGKNLINTDVADQPVTVDIPECDRIQVKASDVIGVYYDFYNPVSVERTNCLAEDQPGFSVANLDVGHTTLQEGIVYNFTDAGCKIFSVRAVVGPVPTCTLPPVPANAVQVTAGDSVAVGQEVEYQCQGGSQLLSGDLRHLCNTCRKVEGAEPTCGDDSTTFEVNKVDLIQREGYDLEQHSFTGDNPNLKITRDGEITQWKFYSTKGGKGRFLVWRPRPDLGTLQFEFVGKNLINSDVINLAVTADIPDCDRIQVKAGDVIGVYYDYWNPVSVERTICLAEEEPGFSAVNLNVGHTTLQIGDVYNFTDAGCKIFSVRAVVGPVPTCTLPPVPANAVQVTTGDSVAVGQEVKYQCGTGFQLLSGDLSRSCNTCRQIEGAEATCGDDSTTYEVNKVDLIKREGYDMYQNSFTGDNSHLKITRDGEITQWKFYSTIGGKGRFMIWRPRPDMGSLQFEYVGKNTLETDTINQPVTVDIPECDRIQVKAGDVIGVYYDYWNPIGVERTNCLAEEEPGFSVGNLAVGHTALQEGVVYNFTDAGCKIFSVRAVVAPVPTCTLPTVPAHAIQVTAGDSVAVGQEAVYQCQGDYQLLSGELRRLCNTCRKLDGHDPLCGDDSTTFEVNRVDLTKREGYDIYKNSFTGDNSNMKIARDGEITQWEFYSTLGGKGRFLVWRPRPDLGSLKFEFVGKNLINTDITNQPVTIDIPECDRIQVKAGDVIGVYYDFYNPVSVERTNCLTEDQPGFSVANLDVGHTTLQEGIVYNFTDAGCKIFSVRAVVGPVPTCTLPAAPERAFKVTAGDSVAVGQEAEYACQASYWLLSGDVRRRCSACRQLEGAEPTCGDNTTSYEANKVLIIKREGFDANHFSYIVSNPHFPISRSGEITQWKFYSTVGGKGRFLIWRPRPDQGSLKFEFIGKNLINTDIANQPVTAEVPECDRIQVKAGDVIGVYYDIYNPVSVERTNCNLEDDPEYAVANGNLGHTSLTEGSVYQFTAAGCKVFSVRAMVGPVPTCTLLPVPANAVQVTTGDSVAVGQEAVYQCKSGFQLLSGDLRRLCDPCRTLKGIEPVCGDDSTTYEVNRVDLIKREGFDIYKNSFTGDNPHFKITRDGEITQWKFYSTLGGKGRFLVWRPRPDSSNLQFEFVGKNLINTDVINQVVTVDIPECDRIQVKAGDVIGVYYDFYNPVSVERTNCLAEEEPGFSAANLDVGHTTLQIGDVYNFTDAGCKIFSVRAVVAPVPTCSLPETPANVVQVTAGDSVAVGQQVKYQCQAGFQLMSGDLTLYCNPCRQLEGIVPTCGGDFTTYEVNDVPLIKREGYDPYQNSFTGDNPHFRISRDGEITQWKFYSTQEGKGRFLVWRPRPDLGSLQFEFVAKNTIYSNVTDQPVTVDIPECDRIQVKAGDVIGVYYDYWNPVSVERTNCNSDETSGFSVANLLEGHTTLVEGNVYQFTDAGCKIFSVRAVVGPMPTCAVPAAPERASKTTVGDSVLVGQEAVYECQSGFQLLSGDLRRLCSPCRQLDGADPTCGDHSTSYEVNKVDIIKREGFDMYKNCFTGDNPHFKITREGEISQWKFYSTLGGKGRFLVWRPRPDIGNLQFEFVGKNLINSDATNQAVTVDVAECDRIQVKAGDVIGVYYDIYNPVSVERTNCLAEEQPGFSAANLDVGHTTLVEGNTYQFTDAGCKIFSVRAVVGPVPTCTLPAAPERAIKVTAGDSVAVGQEAVYQCQAGLQALSGDLRRQCRCDRQLSGASPTCGDDSTTFEVNRVDLIKREGFDSEKYSFTGDNPNLKIARDGEITQWKFYSTLGGKGRFLVWRPRPDLGTLRFQLVGKNLINSDVINQPVTADVPECDRIQVKAGDVIGVYYDYWNPISVERTNCLADEEPGFSAANLNVGHTTLVEGDTYQFTDAGCKIFSVRAVVAPVPTCTLPPVPANAEQVTAGDSVAVGQEVEYQCKSGFQLLSGDLRQACSPCRNLKGIEPTCGDSSTTYEVNKVDLIQREGYDIYKHSFTGDNPHFKITRDGEITQWKFYSTQGGKGRFLVWRPRPDVGSLQFEFVGKNLILSDVTNQPVTADVPECDRIQVKDGDVIGVYYDNYNLVSVERTNCLADEEPGFSAANLDVGHTTLEEGSAYQFTDAGCKIFSVRAVVGPVPTCTLPPVPANAVQVTAGDSVAVGQEVEYQCKSGLQLLSGDLKHLCNCDRRIVGIEPTCGDDSSSYEVNRVDMIKREGFDMYKNSFTGDNPHFKITRDGEITQWKFYSTLGGKGRFLVWRPRPDVGSLQFEFVGKNLINTDVTNQPVTADIPECDRIQVKAGDVIGVYYDYWNPVSVERTNCLADEEPGFSAANLDVGHTTLVEGNTYQFTDAGCKIFSVRAVVAPVPTCAVPAAPERAAKVTAGDSVAVGQEAVYQCQAGFQLLSGDLRRLCSTCRTLMGAAPTCGDDTTTYEVNKADLIKREGFDIYKNSFTGDNPHFKITRDGEITQWKFYSTLGGKGRFLVWRPRPDLGTLRFEFVGKNLINTDVTNQPETADVPQCDRIQVKAGDVIGVYYDFYNPVSVERTNCLAEDQPGFSVANLDVGHTTLVEGNTYQFTDAGCKIFSVRAVVAPVPTCAVPAAPEKASKVTAGDSVAVGQEAVYQCQAGFQLLSGDLRRLCRCDKTLRGAEPTCGDASTTYEVNKVPLIQREGANWWDGTFTGDNPHFKITRDGEITQWKYYSAQGGKGRFLIWRPRPDVGNLQFEFVGKNLVTNDVTNQPVTADVPECDRIQVKAGDVIGVYYDYWNTISVERSSCQAEEEPGFSVGHGSMGHTTLEEGSVYEFTAADCKIFSVRAVVGPVPTCTLPPVPANVVQVTTGESVAVGQEVVYQCKTGLQLLSGDLRHLCKCGRQLRGLEPTCGDASTTYEVNKVPLIQREGANWWDGTFTGDNPHFKITRDGEITQWKYYSAQGGKGRFLVWRPRPDIGTLQFEFVGKNLVTSDVTNQPVTADVPECDRIQVKAGDVIGVYYDYWNKISVERSSCQAEEEPGFSVGNGNMGHTTLKEGGVYQFTAAGCKIFSVRAVVGPVPMCSLPETPANVVQVTTGDSVAVGQEVLYQCKAGLQLLSGDLTRPCRCGRQLGGSEPTCGDASTTYEVNKVPLIQREGANWWDGTFTGDNPHFKITRDGEITQWKFYSTQGGKGRFLVWRPRPDLGNLQFEFVGKNLILSDVTNQPVTADVPECDRIQVKAGDVIGVYYDYWNKISVERSSCLSEEEPGFSVGNGKMSHLTLEKGAVYNFTDAGCKIFSVRAVVGPVPTCTLPPVPANAVQVTAGDSVAVGQEVEYRCQDGYSLIFGSLKQKCLACPRQLEGFRPECSEVI